jgi:hypothetical protein
MEKGVSRDFLGLEEMKAVRRALEGKRHKGVRLR